MSQKNPTPSRLQNTLNELDTAWEQWNSCTNKAGEEQASQNSPRELEKKTKILLKDLRDQIKEFESSDSQSSEPS